MEAIGTIYKGVRFRSRLEARWAVFFDECGIVWEYEPETFKLNNGILYCPDFYIKEMDTYVEIKPTKKLNEIELKKLELFEFTIVLVIGFPLENEWKLFMQDNNGFDWLVYPWRYTDHWELCPYPGAKDLGSWTIDPIIEYAAKTAREYDFFKFSKK